MKLFDDRRDFLYDMVNFYGSNTKRRSINRGFATSPQGCYLHKYGMMCVIGRHIHADKRSIHLRGSIRNMWLYHPNTNTSENVELSEYLPKKVLALGIDFLSAVTGLHDSDTCWNDEVGLTSTGQYYFNKIIRTFCTAEIHIDYEQEYVHRQDQNF